MFNGFKYTKQLEEAGFSRQQAEAQLQIISEIIEGEMATKQDLRTLETNVLNLIELKSNNLESKIQQLEYKITIKLGTLLIVGFTSMSALFKFWLLH